ncbi:MAG: serpin family protein [Planctomycetota bacterium]
MKKTLNLILVTVFVLNTISFAEEKKDDAAEMIVNGNTQFAMDLYGQLKDKEGNLFFSPYSISTALAMTYAGASGQTKEQMANTLHFRQPVEVLLSDADGHEKVDYWTDAHFHNGFGQLIGQLNQQGQKGDYQLSVANALWGQKDYTFLDSFIDLNKQHYKAGLENVDFVKETEKTRLKINQWVEDQTQEKIKDLIPKGVLDALTRLVLTNAIYFKGDWASQFDEAKTTDQDFYLSADKTVKAPLMFQKEKFNYGQTDTLQLLELPYKGDNLSMLILLPKAKDGLSKLEEELNADNLTKWQTQMREREIEVFLPKFKMTSQFGLSDTLATMGMPDAFSRNADFSGMDGTKMLYISAVLHKAFVEVNEEGTEAAAATGVVMSLKSMPMRPLVFRADHPFVFVIKDNNTGSLLFVGRAADPTKTGE